MTNALGSEAAVFSRSIAVPRTSEPRIRREGIRWHGGVGGRPLTIELEVENPGPEWSACSTVYVEVAPFGAFLPWRPLTRLRLPEIPPGGRVVLTATAGDDELPRSEANPVRRRSPLLGRGLVGRSSPAAFLNALLGRRSQSAIEGLESVHFVGNLNVYRIRSAPIERHRQVAIGLQAGAENWSQFCIGDGRVDEYTLRPEADPEWRVELVAADWNTPQRGTHLTALVCFVPPPTAKSGRVVIWVRRASTAEEVPVEFELMTVAPAPECYVR